MEARVRRAAVVIAAVAIGLGLQFLFLLPFPFIVWAVDDVHRPLVRARRAHPGATDLAVA